MYLLIATCAAVLLAGMTKVQDGGAVALPSLSLKIVKFLQELGIDPVMRGAVPAYRYELKEFWDTVSLQNSGTEVDAFQTDRATAGLTVCNLETKGMLDINSDVLVVGLAVDYVFAPDGADVASDDAALLRNHGVIKEIRVNDRRVLDPMLFNALPSNRGNTLTGTGYDAVTPNIDSVVNGKPGAGILPQLLPPPNRFYVAAGERINVPCTQISGSNLSATRLARVHIFGVRLMSKGGTPNNA